MGLFDEELRYLSPNSKEFLGSRTKVRNHIYGNRDNILARLDKQISQKFFGTNTPFRFLPGGDVLQYASEHIMTLRVAIDLYYFTKDSSDPIIQSSLELMKQFTPENVFQKRDEWKKLTQCYRDTSFDMNRQFILTIFRGLYIEQSSKVTIPFIDEYLEEFGRTEPPKDEYELSSCMKMALNELAQVISLRLEKNDFPVHVPACRDKMSSMGHKKNQDWNDLMGQINQCEQENLTINSFAKKAILLSLECIEEVYSFDLSLYKQRINKLNDSEESIILIECLPQGAAVSQSKGKISRIVFKGNDILDLALDPIMQTAKYMKAGLPSCMSNNDAASVSNYSFAKIKAAKWKAGIKFKVSNQRTVTIKSSMEGADSSNATERINGFYMCKIYKYLWSCLSERARSNLHVSEKYIDLCIELLCSTPFYFLHRGNYVISWTNGTAQGLCGSWDFLDLTTLAIIAESYCMYFLREYPKSDYSVLAIKALNYSGNMGDDGLYAHIISDLFKSNLQRVSLPGVVSLEKTQDEDSIGYAPFASAFVSSKEGLPPIISNMRIISTLVRLSDPYSFQDIQKDKYNRYQYKKVRETLNWFRTIYNRTDRQMIDESPEVIADYINFSGTEKMLRYYAIRDSILLMELTCQLRPREGTNVAPIKELAPSYRARNLYIRDMAISSSRMYTILSYKQLEACFEGVESTLIDLDRDLEEARYLHFEDGIPWSEVVLDNYDRQFHQLINRFGAPFDRRVTIHASALRQYNATFEGYYNTNLLISCKLDEIRR